MNGVKKATTDRGSDIFPDPVYRRTVLEEIFKKAQVYFLDPLLEIECAHALMLARQKIIPEESAAICLRGLEQFDVEQMRREPYDPDVEDLYFYIEKKLIEVCGAEHAGRIRTARSRNDVDMTMYRMVLRSRTLGMFRSLVRLREVMVRLAWDHRASLITAYTHQQPAQPTTLGHYLMASVEWMERDARRLQAAYSNLNHSPLGACAITGTGFPIDRDYTAALLGFEGIQLNSFGAIASVDYLTEACSALMVSMVNLGRFTQDLLLWSTAEYGYLTLSDAFVQVSSIMPQKRNPVALEHVRALASRALLQAQGVLTLLHNTPFADMNDAEDDLQPTAYSAFDDAARAFDLAAGLLETARFDTARMEACAHSNFLTVTELADVLVRSTGISFRTAHEIVSQAVKEAGHTDASSQARTSDPEKIIDGVERAFPRITGGALELDRKVLHRALDPRHFVDVRKTPGGPSAEVLAKTITLAKERLAADISWVEAAEARIEQARQRLEEQTEAFLASNPAA
jgi:argininosuccinate lyase